MSQPTITSVVADRLKALVDGWAAPPGVQGINDVLRYLAKWRSQVLASTYVQRQGVAIWQGPFEGMNYLAASTEGALISRLLGCYESELHPHLLAIVEEGLDCVIDVGCAEGYYAVGLARRFPGLSVHARDISEAARNACNALAARNGVTDQVIVGGAFGPKDFAAFSDQRVLVLVDAEGAELDVLKPDLAPALAKMKIIVETHDVFRPGALKILIDRFAPTHDIVRVDSGPKAFVQPGWLSELSHLDQVLAAWEWRQAPTPWLVMRPKAA